MPVDPGSGLFSRAWRFVNQFSVGADIGRQDLDTALDDFVPAINSALLAKSEAQTAAALAQSYAVAATAAGATAGAAAGAAAAEIAAAAKVAEAAAFASDAEAARDEAEGFAAAIDPDRLAAAVESAFSGDLNSVAPERSVTFYPLTTGALNGFPGAGSTDIVMHMAWSSTHAIQMGFNSGGTSMLWTRSKVAGTWSDWANVMATVGDHVLAGGYTYTSINDGTRTTGSYRPAPAGGNMRRIANGGAFSIAAPNQIGDYSIIVLLTNTASAGAISLTGSTKVTGSTLTTTNGHRFMLFMTRINGLCLLNIESLQ